jgi:hypothetical protein
MAYFQKRSTDRPTCNNNIYNMKFRKWVMKIHLYGGLLCFWYIVIFAISSLHFQHHSESADAESMNETVFEKKCNFPADVPDSALAVMIKNELDVAGWHLPWRTSRESNGIFHTEIQNPKSRYRVTYYPADSSMKIIRSDRGPWHVLNSLHGYSGKMPNAPLLLFWKIYTYICLVVVIFSIFSGIWLWIAGKNEKRSAILTVSGIVALSLLLMIYIYFHG